MTTALFKCSCCDKSFKSEKAIRAHKAVKTARKLYSCVKCRREHTTNNRKSHEAMCYGLPDSPVWNKGKTKESHPELEASLSAGGMAMADRVANGYQSALSQYWKTPEKRKEKSEWRKQLHKDNPETHPNRRLAGNRSKMSYPERLVFELLTEHGIQFEHNKKVDKFFPDFVIGKQIIEIDGAKWHDIESDTKRDERLIELGYAVERFVVGSNKDLIQRVKTFLAIN